MLLHVRTKSHSNLTRDALYAKHTGTSSASAFVTGAVATLLHTNPTLKPNEIQHLLEHSSTKQVYLKSIHRSQPIVQLSFSNPMNSTSSSSSTSMNVNHPPVQRKEDEMNKKHVNSSTHPGLVSSTNASTTLSSSTLLPSSSKVWLSWLIPSVSVPIFLVLSVAGYAFFKKRHRSSTSSMNGQTKKYQPHPNAHELRFSNRSSYVSQTFSQVSTTSSFFQEEEREEGTLIRPPSRAKLSTEYFLNETHSIPQTSYVQPIKKQMITSYSMYSTLK
ncbi:hypothetical protein HMI56_007269 [Coelomomyces lativittatus]|nr:hypothetical protein HMI56_007269 [Coelomomyces lativittatus]